MNRQMTFQEAANAVKLSLDIVDVVGRYVALRRAGRNYIGLCPFHQEKTPSFSVNHEKQMFKCFGCGEGGDTLSFLMKHDNKTYGEMITELAQDQGIDIIREGHYQKQKDDLDIIYKLHSLAQKFYQEQRQKSDTVKAYLEERQVDSNWQNHFGIGYAPPGWENLVNYLKQHEPQVSQTPNSLEKAGLANLRSEGNGHYDRFRNRLMIPIHDDRGRVVAFGGRNLDPEDIPKYLNSPETPIYVKSRILYGYSWSKEAIRTDKYAILMEGYFDVIAAHMAGISQAVGVCGTALTESHLKLLQRAGAEKLYLCFDSDKAGQNAALRAIELVQNQLLDQGILVKVVLLPGEKDPDDFLKTQGKERFLECLENAQDFLSFKFAKALSERSEDINTSEGRIQAVQSITPMLLEIRQPVIRQEYIKQLADQLHITEETLMLEVNRLEKENPTYQNKKNYQNDAIFPSPDRYIGKKPWGTPKRRQRPEDITIFRQKLSQKIPITEKEHLLLSYLLLSEEGYRLVMQTLPQLQIQSPQAETFLKTVYTLEGQWRTIDELIHQLSSTFHTSGQEEQLQFLAHRIMVAGEIEESYENASRGLKSLNHREKLNRDIDEIANRILFLQKRTALNVLAQHGKQHEQEEDDQLALQIQLQLREELKARRKSNPQSQEIIDTPIKFQEEQGV